MVRWEAERARRTGEHLRRHLDRRGAAAQAAHTVRWRKGERRDPQAGEAITEASAVRLGSWVKGYLRWPW
jgi:hypothetical protein